MKQLLIIKERLKKFVGKNDVFILPILKFLITFFALSQINSSLGYMHALKNGAITLIIALAGSFLPVNLTLVILALISVAHIYALSLECAILVLVLFLILFLLYFRFSANDAVAAILVPVSFAFKVPYVIPVSMGLVGGPTSMVSVGCGVIVYYVLHFISVNASSLSSSGIDASKLGAFKEVVDSMLNNKAMLVMTFAFAATVLIVYLIRRLPIPYSWTIAIAAGTLSCFIIILMGNAATHAGISLGGVFFGIIISAILNIVLQYFCFDLDYNRTEKVQFEDDEYYYYVKAVPKNTIKLSDNGKKKPAPAKASAKPVTHTQRPAVPVRREPVENTKAESRTPNPNRARETVRSTAASAARARTSQRGPLGLSGGRPAGEGRKVNSDGKPD